MRSICHFTLLIVSVLLLFNSCANYKDNYIPSETNWRVHNVLPDTLDVIYTIYLLGDAGNSSQGDTAPAVKYFNKMLAQAGENSAAIILGDNIYPKGLPKKSEPIAREEAEHDLVVQLEGLTKENFKGQPIIIMGNHDWGQSDPINGVERQERFIHNFLDRGQIVFPEAGCGDPTTVELTDDLVVICIDSQWWIEDWTRLPDINDGCDVTSREAFLEYFEDQLTDHKGKNILVALHHPPYTNGSHGGQYTLLSYLFPLRDLNKNFWIPFPILGNLINATRSSVGTETDSNNPVYAGLARGIIALAEKHDSVLFVSGHEHALQYFEVESQRFIVSGSGAKSTATRAGNGALFTTSRHGHVVVKILEDGSMWGEFYGASYDGETGTLLYRSKIKGPLPAIDDDLPSTPEKKNKLTHLKNGEIVEASVYPDSVLLDLNKAIFGRYNSDLFFTKVKAPVILLDQHLGGMEIVREGGSTQTLSLRLKDKQGRSYVLRSLRKDPTRTLPAGLNFPLSQKLMAHFLTGANPFGAFAIPRLAEALGIYHTQPRLYYMPRHAALGNFNERYGDQLYLLEERPDESWTSSGRFGQPTEMVSYRKLFNEIRSEKDKVVQVNQELALRNRLLDILIGDFDRHLDQFRFAKREAKDSFIYDPIPRDRDLAFSNWDGLAFRIGTLVDPKIRASHSFGEEIDNIKWLIYQSRGFDNNFLNELGWDTWEEVVQSVQLRLTDEVIDRALKEMPPRIYRLEGPKIKRGLQARRENLLRYAREFYEIVNEVVEIVGTDLNDIFEVERMEAGRTKVTGWTSTEKLEKKKIKFYERTFDPKVTKEIRIYGLDNQDLFRVTGEADKGIRVRLIGGFEVDTFIDQSKVKGWSKKTVINDAPGENVLQGGSETRDNRSNLNLFNAFIFLKRELGINYLSPFANAGYNPDDGIFVGLQFDFHTFPYRRHNLQQVRANYALATRAFNFSYKGEFKSIFNNRWDLMLDAQLSGPQFTKNYFGFGNETQLFGNNRKDYNFNRVRREQYQFRPALKKELMTGSYYTFGLITEAVRIEKTDDRILVADGLTVDPDVFDFNFFAGGEAGLVFDFVDDLINPANGIRFKAGASWRANVQQFDQNYLNLNTSLSFYQAWGVPWRLVLASRLGWSQNFGQYYFYQGVELGGSENLRGYRQNRFTGNTVMYHNTDLRLRLFTSQNKFIAFSFGLLAGFDYGRVWVKEDHSNRWHSGYGGGIWISPLNVVVINASYFQSPEDKRFVLKLGYLF